MGAPTAKLETVIIYSPVKTLAYVFNMIAFLFAVLALLGTFWVIEDKDTRYGLWQKCEITNGTQAEVNDDDPFNNEHMECALFNKVWTQLCGALVTVAAICAGVGIALIYLGFNHSERQDRKMKYYRSALFVYFIGFLLLSLALGIFPLYFVNQLGYSSEATWYFGWSYGIGWGAAIFLFAAAVLLICDRNREEIFYKETLYLNQEEEEEKAGEA